MLELRGPGGIRFSDQSTQETAYAITEVEVDFGTKPVKVKRFTIANASVTTASKVFVRPSGKPAAGRGTDDWEWDWIDAVANPGNGQFVMTCHSKTKVKGKRKFLYSFI